MSQEFYFLSEAEISEDGTLQDYDSQSQIIQQDVDVAELIIQAIHNRQPLWDHTLPVTQRSKSIKDALWLEVFNELEGRFSIEQIQKKWKNLRDQLNKEKSGGTYVASGSARVEKKKKWKHFDAMQFLTEINQPRQTVTNLQPTSSGSVENAMLSPTGKGKKRRANDDVDEEILRILSKPVPVPTILSSMQTASEILSQLPKKVRMKAESQILTYVYKLAEEHIE